MPIHHRIPGIIGQAISRYGPAGNKLLQSDKLVLNKAWTGFKHKSSIVSGIRSGLFAGGVAGQFIRDSDNPEMDAQVPFFPQTSSPYKARGGRGGYRRRYTKCRCRSNKYSRRSSPYRSRKLRNRF